MSNQLAILDAMPSAADFYARYWGQRPFVVRGAIARGVMDGLIADDELAGLSMEEAPQSRMVKTAGERHDWSCGFGPFDEDDFKSAGDRDWSLLVQNVEQFHPDTAALLRHFNFAPRWLMDDIMVSFSAKGGSVGPHIDSYHVFLVQGQGKRHWKVGRQPIEQEIFIEGLDLKVLEGGFDGDEVEVSCGDVLYIPPKFGHEGTTLENALTFSVGFLGPKMSELFIGYGQYLSELEDRDQRYVGAGLSDDSASFAISSAALGDVRDCFSKHLKAKDFEQWLVEFFTESSHEDFGNYAEREDTLDADAFEAALKDGASLIKPPYVKFAITSPADGRFCLGFDARSFTLDEGLLSVVEMFAAEGTVSGSILFEHPATLEFLLELYNHQALEFSDSL